MKTSKIKTLSLLIMPFWALTVQSTVVRFETNVGNIDIELYDTETPVTVQNFLNYVNDGDYDGTVIHRTDPGFIIQGGGYRFLGNGQFEKVPTNSAITNEAEISNLTGTISMARNSNANSATNQWFFNMANNTGLDKTNSSAGYAVFGEVIKGMETLYLIESFLRINFFDATPTGAFGEFPLYRYDEGSAQPVLQENIVEIISAYQLSEEFQVNAGLSGAYYNPATNGQGIYLEVLPNLSQVVMAWFTYDTIVPDDLTPSEIGYSGGRWLTASGTFQGNVFTGTAYESSGGIFENAAPVSNTPVGSVTMTFNSCSEIIMSYSLYGSTLNGMNTLQRIAASNIALCERLASEANQGVGQ